MSLFSAAATVLVVAPPTLQRQGLLATLRDARPDLPVTTTADTRTLPERLRRGAPALLILDAALPGVALDEVVEQVRTNHPNQRILMLGGRRLPFAVARLVVEMGGRMLLARRATPADLVAAVARLLGDESTSFLSPDAQEPRCAYARRHPVDAAPISLFSSRELEVLRLVAEDYSSQEIAARLFISVRTVETHRRLLLEKAGARSMIGLVLQAVRAGWLEVS